MNLEALSPKDLLDVGVRRKWLVLSTVIVCTGLAYALCIVLPKSYRSTTVIMVENQRIPESYVSAVVGGTISERLTLIKQQVLSRTVLQHVIEEFKLMPPNESDEGAKEGLIEALRKNIVVDTKGAPGSNRIDSFSISFAHQDPRTAMLVTANLANQFVDENLRAREQLVEGTTEFLDQELARAKTSLEEQEHAIAMFKRKYMGELPGQMDANLQTLNRFQRDLTSVSESIQNRSDRRAALQKMLNMYETMGVALLEGPRESLQDQTNESQTQVRSSSATSGRAVRGSDPLSVRLRELERQLITLTAEYKSTYPDIVQLKQEIAQVKAQLAERTGAGERETKEEGDSPKASVERKLAAKIVPVDPYLHELKRERDENEVGLIGMKEQQRRLIDQIREYQGRVERAPEREQDLIVLQRDYENTKKNYQALLDKQLNARVSENLEKRQKAEKFRILDPANLPTRPESPDTMKIMLAGLMLGCGLGYGTAFGLEFMAGVIRSPDEAERLFGLPVLAVISQFQLAYTNERTKALPEFSAASPLEAPPKGDMTALSPHLLEKSQQGLGRKGVGQLWKKDSLQTRFGSKNGAISGSIMSEMNLVTKWRPLSMVAEQFRVAATRLVLSSANQKNAVIVVTSALKGEGKSTTASNLAYVLAHDLGKQTLLVDCDFKCPMLHTYTGMPSKPGLVELIYGDAPLEACLHQSGDGPLWILPSGRRDHRLVDLTKIPQISGILTDLRTRFEFIILDAPPILPLADMNLLASMADMLVLVIRAGVTHHELVQRSLKTLKPLSRAGVILTGYNQSDDSAYRQGRYDAVQGSYH